jgi:nicotinate-nucleotide adenylyltransferase
MTVRRVAFFGGSFDPPHFGHLAVARAARDLLGLDLILFAPVGVQPLKGSGAGAGFEDRVAMTRLAVDGEVGFEVSVVDAPQVDGSGSAHANFTIETLERLRGELPPETALFHLMGADSFRSLRLWRRAAEIPFAAEIIVASRPGEPLEDLASSLPEGLRLSTPEEIAVGGGGVRRYVVQDKTGRSARLFFLPELRVDISATGIRGERETLNERVPEAVMEYIFAHRLYGH